MKRGVAFTLSLLLVPTAFASQTHSVSHRDRVYAAEQFSNTVSVTDPVDNRVLGVIKLGDPLPGNLSPLYRGQLLVHGLGFSPDHRTLAVVAVGSNSVSLIDTQTNAVKHVAYLGRSPHEAFFTPDGRELWVSIRGESYIAVLDGTTYAEKDRITVPSGPGMQIFSPDGKYGYVCSSFTPETVVIEVATHRIVGRVAQESPFCPNIAASPDGEQVWLTLKDIGKVMAFEARPPFRVLRSIDTGPITNHVNFIRRADETFAYVSIGGRNEVQVFDTKDFRKVSTVVVGQLPHGLWPSGDGTRMYVALENEDMLAVIDTSNHRVVAHIPIGQGAQAVVYVPNAVPEGNGMAGLQPLSTVGTATQLTLKSVPGTGNASSSITLFDQGLIQVLQAAVSGLQPKSPYVLALARTPDGKRELEPLAAFTTNPSGAAVVNAVGPIRQVVRTETTANRRYLVIAPGTAADFSEPVQIQDSIRP